MPNHVSGYCIYILLFWFQLHFKGKCNCCSDSVPWQHFPIFTRATFMFRIHVVGSGLGLHACRAQNIESNYRRGSWCRRTKAFWSEMTPAVLYLNEGQLLRSQSLLTNVVLSFLFLNPCQRHTSLFPFAAHYVTLRDETNSVTHLEETLRIQMSVITSNSF